MEYERAAFSRERPLDARESILRVVRGMRHNPVLGAKSDGERALERTLGNIRPMRGRTRSSDGRGRVNSMDMR